MCGLNRAATKVLVGLKFLISAFVSVIEPAVRLAD
jgi:hypothetical protein